MPSDMNLTAQDARCSIEVYKVLWPRLYRVARAIEVYEGWDKRDTLAWFNNNPGNLRSSPFAISTNRGFAVFSSYPVGFLALLHDLRVKASGRSKTGLTPFHSLHHLMLVYAPPHENDTVAYVTFIETRTDLPATTRLEDLL